MNSLVANQPDGRLHVKVKLHDFRELLNSVAVTPPTTSVAATVTTHLAPAGHD